MRYLLRVPLGGRKGGLFEFTKSMDEPSEGFNPKLMCGPEAREFFRRCLAFGEPVSPQACFGARGFFEFLIGGRDLSDKALGEKFEEMISWNKLFVNGTNEPPLMPFVQKKKVPPPPKYMTMDEFLEGKRVKEGEEKVLPDITIPNWIKIKANYADPWNTPLPAENVRLSIGGTTLIDKLALNKGLGESTVSNSLQDAQNTADEPGVVVVQDIPMGFVQADFIREPGLEKEIASLRDTLQIKLDGAYRDTVNQMKGFQEQWDTYGYAAIAVSGASGLYSAASEWVDDQADLLEAETWSSLGTAISEATGKAFDSMSDYASESFDKIVKNANDAVEWVDENSDNLQSWHWWSTQADEAIDTAKDTYKDIQTDVQQHLNDAADFLSKSQDAIEKLQKHKGEILKLPQYIAEGDPEKVENFVDTVLTDIDPALAKEIKNNPNFHLVLELIADHDSALTYFAYVDLFMEAVPPNFYAYIAGKGGAYIALEVLLLIALSFLTLGAGTVARIATLAARLAASSAKAAGLSKKVDRAQAAIQAFQRTIEDFADSTLILKELGQKLHKARNGDKAKRGKESTTLTIKKENEKRNSRCRVCHKSDHTTPRSRRGCVVYK